MSRMVYAESQDRQKRTQLGQIGSAAVRRARGAGVRLDLRAADRAGVESMIAAVGDDEILTGVSKQDRAAMVRQLEQWQESGMSSSEIQRRMRSSALFQDAGVDPRQLELSAAKGRTGSLADQLESNESNIVRGEQAKYLFGIDPKSKSARAARRQYQRLARAGKFEEAQAVLDKYADTLDPKVQGDVKRVNKRISERIKESTKRLTEKKDGEYTLGVDPTERAKLGTDRAQAAAQARARAMEEGVDANVLEEQLAEGDDVEKRVREQEVGGVKELREVTKAMPGKKGFWGRWMDARSQKSMFWGANPALKAASEVVSLGQAFMGEEESKAENQGTLERDREGPIEVIIVENKSYRRTGGKAGSPRGTRRRG